jgi:hypothetical protein
MHSQGHGLIEESKRTRGRTLCRGRSNDPCRSSGSLLEEEAMSPSPSHLRTAEHGDVVSEISSDSPWGLTFCNDKRLQKPH